MPILRKTVRLAAQSSGTRNSMPSTQADPERNPSLQENADVAAEAPRDGRGDERGGKSTSENHPSDAKKTRMSTLHDIVGRALQEASYRRMTTNGQVDAVCAEIEQVYRPKSFVEAITDGQEEEQHLGSPTFHGDVEARDEKPLTKSAYIIFEFMAQHAGEYHTHEEIAEATGVHIVTVGDRVRDFRMAEWGSHQTPKRRRGATRQWEYTMIPNKESLQYRTYIVGKAKQAGMEKALAAPPSVLRYTEGKIVPTEGSDDSRGISEGRSRSDCENGHLTPCSTPHAA